MSETVDVVVWGAGGHAAVVADVLAAAGGFRVVGFLCDAPHAASVRGELRSSLLGGEEALHGLIARGVRHGIAAIGDAGARRSAADRMRAMGMGLATPVHPSAVVAPGALIGAGTVVCARAVLNPGVRVGADVIVNTGAIVDHDCVVGDAAHLAPGVTLAGRVTVGARAWVGVGATVIDGASIGEGSLVGAGAVVVCDIPPGVVAYGVPARVIRERSAG
ncbi:MAG: NeuD/PglB/VioB family sugar acetyltransferase [Chthonomonadales bacterium]|nr:NeuD/PglB/VioB family sugar acetyltransferase [Chthonomonadales bacterium]